MTDRPPDAAARARALDPATSFIVQAPAGSGKTTLLTQRFLALLARASRPEAVLAITFTQKAAAEMRTRVAEALSRAAANAQPRNAADADTLALARAVLAHAQQAGWSLAEQPARLRIQTIDSLNHWIAARLPILSRAGVSIEVEPRAAELHALAARRTLARLDEPGRLADALARVLAHFDNDAERLVELLAAMLAARERWLRIVVAGAGASDALRAELERALAHVVATVLARARACLSRGPDRALLGLARAAAARLGERPGCAALAAGEGLLAATAEALPAWRALAGLLLRKDGEWRQRLSVTEGFPPELKADKQAFLALIDELKSVAGLREALVAVAPLPPLRYADAEWTVLAALYEVLIAAAAELQAVFAERGRADFVAVAHAALEALGTAEEPTDLTLALDERLEHILVDEFQDTSATQVALLERLTAGWQAGDGRTLFLVGDPMQSIYRFREANVSLFLAIRDAGLGALRLEPLALSANFRSRPALVAWYNATFAAVLPPADDPAEGAVRYAPSVAVREPKDERGVRLELLLDGSPADEAARVADIVARELAAHPETRIAVLGRTRTQLTPVATTLRARGIPYQGLELVPLGERLAVRDLVALTRALVHLGDRIAWLACLRAPWCGLDLGALALLAGDAEGLTIWEALGDEARIDALEPAARARCVATRAVLGKALAERGRRPLAASVEAAWIALGGPATLEDEADLENVRSFLARLDVLERAGDLDDPGRLEAELEDLYAAPDPAASERLQLLTVHRAKGLEWDVVVLTGLGRGSRSDERWLIDWLEFAVAGGATELVVAPHRATSRASEPLEQWMRGLAGARGALELGRLLYVAATRAEERLYLVGHVAQGEDGLRRPTRRTLLERLWPAIETEAAAAARAPEARVPAAAGAATLVRLAADWAAPPPRDAAVAVSDPARPEGPSEFEFEWVTVAARHVGSVVHEELERAAALSQPLAALWQGREGAWRRRLAELGVGPAQLADALARVARALAATAADARGRWLFDPAHRETASELGLSALAGGRVVAARIDRTFVDADGVRWIVDFKTSLHEGRDLDAFLDQERARYTAQLERYATLLAAAEPGRPIRLGLYFPLHAAWREWVPGEAPTPARR